MLYETLRECTSHPTAEELYRMLAGSGGSMSRATVYNTLEALCRAGLIRRIAMPAGSCRFDGDTSQHLHVRVGESEILDVPADLGRQLVAGIPQGTIEAIEREMGVTIESLNIQLIASKPT